MLHQTIAVLYEKVLASVLRGKNLLAAELYLQRIGQRLEEIRAAYRAPNVTIDYSDPALVDAYLLGYYPHYVATASEALAHIPCDTFRAWGLLGFRVLFIGGGPLPELIALVDRLVECGITRAAVHATVIDTHATAWAGAIAHTETICRDIAPHIDVRVEALQADARDALALHHADESVGKNLIVMQNRLNEVAEGLDVEEHCELLRLILEPGGVIAISDLTEYPVICGTVDRYERQFERAGLLPLHRFNPNIAQVQSPFHRPPPRVFYGFFGAVRNGDLYTVPRQPKKWLRFSTSVWQDPRQ